MLRTISLSLALVLGSGPLTTAFAQRGGGAMPSPDVIARADTFEPPLLGDLGAKLAQQPDMTGTWQQVQPANAGQGPAFDPEHTIYPPQPLPGEATFGPIPGTYMPDIPYTPEYKKRYEANVNDAKRGKDRDTFAACVPYGVPRMLGSSPVAFDIVQAPEVMFWYNPYVLTQRKIHLDGRAHPPLREGGATGGGGRSYSGHSVGHWEGKTLVVDTVDMIPNSFDETGSPHSDKLHLVERLRLIDNDVLENRMTFTDPEAFTGPWKVTRYYRRQSPAGTAPAPGVIHHAYIDLNDRPCVPNIRFDEEGYQIVLLPQEVEAEAAKAQGRMGKTPDPADAK